MPDQPLPDFEKPPVIEVVCGVQFQQLKDLTTPHFGLLWERFKPEYSSCKEVNPLTPTIEKFGESPKVSFEITEVPPLPRIWFLNKEDTGIIQIQQDRFLHNWRKNLPEEEYPRYPYVIGKFKDHYSVFLSYLNENEIGPPKLNQLELTYVNHIPQGMGWEKLSDLGNVFQDFSWDGDRKQFLPEVSDINFRTTFDLPNEEGRLHVKIVKGFIGDNKLPILRLDLTVRGLTMEGSDQEIWSWFDQARKWIVRGFADVTNEKIQNSVWGRKV